MLYYPSMSLAPVRRSCPGAAAGVIPFGIIHVPFALERAGG